MRKALLILITFVAQVLFFTDVQAVVWPSSSGWNESKELQPSELSRGACQKMDQFVKGEIQLRNKKSEDDPLKPFSTDGIVVIKDGYKAYEWYDSMYNASVPHVLWSASKTVTATLIARALYDGVSYQGKTVTLNTPLNRFFPKDPVKYTYDDILLRHVVNMSIPYEWNEVYESNVSKSTFIPMLYLGGRLNMHQYALEQPFLDIEPGKKLTYSGGNSNILQAILKKIYGTEYEDLPWESLFDRLEMKNVRWERDEEGYFVGSSYVYMRPRDLARYGYLYLNNGVWRGERLLPKSWVQAAQKLALSNFHQETDEDYIESLGAMSKRVFWVNQDIRRAGEVVYSKEFPGAPKDMYFTAGHYGQLSIVIPSERVVIARTGHDSYYWWHIEPLVETTLECLKQYPRFESAEDS